jgi:hypothetical protein
LAGGSSVMMSISDGGGAEATMPDEGEVWEV